MLENVTIFTEITLQYIKKKFKFLVENSCLALDNC
jgi:hypothetical protein